MRSLVLPTRLSALGLAVVLIAAMNPALAIDNARQSIRVQGTGGIDARPNQAVILAAVVDQEARAGAALEANSREMARVLQKLAEFAVAEADIQTQGFSVTPVFERHHDASHHRLPRRQPDRGQGARTRSSRRDARRAGRRRRGPARRHSVLDHGARAARR